MALEQLKRVAEGGTVNEDELERLRPLVSALPREELLPLGKALWQLDAGAKELACEILAVEGKCEQSMWSLAGKAWLDMGSFRPALRCLKKAAAASAEGQASAQIRLWTAMALLHSGEAKEAQEAFVEAATMSSAMLQPGVEAAAHLRQRGELSAALELLARLEPAGEVPGAASVSRAELLRQKALCLLEVAEDFEAAEGAVRTACGLELGETAGRARSLNVLVQVLARQAKESEAKEKELQEIALDLMSQKLASLQECMDACRALTEGGFDQLLTKCLVRLRRRTAAAKGTAGQVARLRLFGAQMLAARVSELSSCAAEFKELAAESLCDWLEEARAGGPNANLGSLLCSLARSLRPEEALLWLQKAQSFTEEPCAVWRALAACHHQLGDQGNMRRCLEAALALRPEDGPCNMLLLLDAVARGEDELVKSLAERVRQRELELGVPEVAFVLGELRSPIAPNASSRLELLELLLDLCQDSAAELHGLKLREIELMCLEAASALPERWARLLPKVRGLRAEAWSEKGMLWLVAVCWNAGSRLLTSGSADLGDQCLEKAVSLLAAREEPVWPGLLEEMQLQLQLAAA